MIEASVFDHPIVVWANVFALLTCWSVLGLIAYGADPGGKSFRIAVAGAAILATATAIFVVL